ncbi:Rhodanese-like domain protein, partial [Arthrobacter sp. DR-2P]
GFHQLPEASLQQALQDGLGCRGQGTPGLGRHAGGCPLSPGMALRTCTPGQARSPGPTPGQHRRHQQEQARDRRLRLRGPLRIGSPAAGCQGIPGLLDPRRNERLAPGRRAGPL